MQQESTIAKDIQVSGDKARYDAACKSLLAEKIILAWLMKSCLDEFRDCEVNEIAERYIEGTPQVGELPLLPDETNAGLSKIRGISTQDTSLTEGTVFYDIRFMAVAPDSREPIQLIVNVEAQNKYNPGYPLIKRGIYYGSRMISSQYGTEFTSSHYEKIKKVYSIWVCTSPPVKHMNTITRYRIAEEPMVGEVREPVRNYDLMSIIIICLGDSDVNAENYSGILKLLGILLSSKIRKEDKKQTLQSEFDIPMTERIEEGVSSMCNLSDEIEERGIQKGIAQGIEQGKQEGIAQGIEQGKQEGIAQGIEQGIKKGITQGIEQGKQEGIKEGTAKATLANIRNLMKNLSISAERAMTVLEVPENEQPEYIQLLNKQ